MRKLFGILFVAIAAMCMLNSCSNEDELNFVTPQKGCADITSLYSQIDSLNSVYTSANVTRSAAYELRFWSHALAAGLIDGAAGVLSINPVVGAVVGTVASACYDRYYVGYFENKMTNTRPRRTAAIISDSVPTIVFSGSNATFSDSVGYYHNHIIEDISKTGKSFVDEDGNIDFDGYFDEVIACCKKYGIYSDDMDLNSSYKSSLFRYLDKFIKQMAETESGDEDTFISILQNDAFKDLNFTEKQTEEFLSKCRHIVYQNAIVDTDTITEYGGKVNELIVTSSLSDDSQNSLKVGNNISVNSKLLWSTTE